ncbi:MAG: lipase family protein [Flavobacteriaceae bacterium]|nr:lipase family protein [Flavobacteriaceae bacterium]
MNKKPKFMSSLDLSCKLLCASASAYCIKPSSKNGQYNPCGDDNSQYNAIGFVKNPFVVTSLRIEAALVGKTDSELIVAFRGTLPPSPLTWDSLLDWIQDLMAKPTSDINLPGEIHSGFLFALISLAEGIKKAIDNLDPTHSLPLYFTGHSKGGGMAPIAAMYFKNAYGLHATQTITFAGPKPGDKEFCSVYNVEFPNDLRYENYLDVVPLLPPSPEFIRLLKELPLPESFEKFLSEAASWDYQTVGSLKYIDAKGDVAVIPTPMIIRVGDIIEKMATLDFSAIGDAHHASCGYRYMKGTCQGNVCPSI